MNPQPLLRSDDLLLIVPKLLENLPITLGITLASLLLGLALGLVATVLQFSRSSLLRWLAKAYTDVLRGAPLALLILLFFFGGKLILSALELPALLISDMTFAILSISVGISPYFAEMMRRYRTKRGDTQSEYSLAHWHCARYFSAGAHYRYSQFRQSVNQSGEDDIAG